MTSAATSYDPGAIGTSSYDVNEGPTGTSGALVVTGYPYRDASASLRVLDGRITASVLASSGL